MSGDVFISFGADTGPLEASFATARAEVRGLQAELNKTANEMRSTGAAADSELGGHLNVLASQLSAAKGQFSELNEELKAHKEASHGAADEVRGLLASFRQLTEGLTGVHEAFSSAAETFAAAFAVHEIKEWINSVQEAGETIERLSAQLGASTGQVQVLGAIAKLTGADFNQMVSGIQRMELRLRESASSNNAAQAALKALNIDIKSFIDLPAPEKLERLAEAAQHFADGPGKDAAFAALNRNLVDMIPALDRGREGFAELEKAARAAGVIMSDQDVKALAEAKEQSAALGLALTGLSQNIELLANGPLTHAVERLSQFVGYLNDAITLARSFGGFGNFIGMTEANQSEALEGRDIFVHPGLNGPHPRNSSTAPKPPVHFNPGEDRTAKGGGAGSDDSAELARAAYQSEVDAARRAAQGQLDALDNLVKQHRISWDEWAKDSIADLEKEKTAIQAAAAEAAKSDALSATEKLRIANETADRLAAIAKKEADDAAKAAEETQKAWDNFFKPFNSLIEGQISALISGHETWAQALKKTLLSATEDVAKFFVQWALKQAEMVAAHLAGNAVIQASDQASSVFGLATMLANAARAIGVDAGVAAAGVTANQAPILGPAALGEGLAVGGSVAGLVSAFDIGAWEIPQSQLALVHQGELVMPSPEAGAFRDFLSGAARGQGQGRDAVHIHPTVNINQSSIDGASTAAFYRRTGPELMKGIDEAVRHGAHLGLKGLRR